MKAVGEEFYFRSDDGERFGHVRVVGYATFFNPFHPVYRVEHVDGECERYVEERHLLPLTSVGAGAP